MKSITVSQKKRGRPATGETPRVGVRLPADLSEGVERYIQAQPEPKPSKSDAIRNILSEWLSEHGFLKIEQSHGLKPDELNAENDD